MLITSSWRVTLGGITLLSFDDLMNDEPALVRTGTVEIVPVIDADNPTIFPRKNISHELTFSRVRIFASDNEARFFLLTHAAELPFDQTYDCTIFIERADPGKKVLITGAVLQPSGYRSSTQSERFTANYQIIGGAITFPTQDGPSLPSPGAETGDHIVTEDGDQIVDESGNKLTT